MSNSDLPTLHFSGQDEDVPLPLIVARKWGFPLAYIETEEGFYFAVQDWIRGLADGTPRQIANIWVNLKAKTHISNVTLPYVASDGKTYQRDHTDDKGLYLIAQNLRVTKSRPVLDEIKKFLAAAGAFADEVRRDASTFVLSGAITPDQAIDAAIQAYRNQGKDDNWIRARLEGKIKRNLFTAALTQAVAEVLSRSHYAMATDDIYKGLWGRTAAILRQEMNLSKKASLRDNQPRLALHYQGIAEEVAAHRLGNRSELTWDEARGIVKAVAAFIGKQAKETSEWLGMDIATGNPLLTAPQGS